MPAMNTHHLYFSTSKVAQLAQVERHVILAAVQRNQHWKGIKPQRLANGHWAWPAVQVYQALHMLPADLPKRDAATLARVALCSSYPELDPWHAQQTLDRFFSPEIEGASKSERLDSLESACRGLLRHIEAIGACARESMSDEDCMNDQDFKRLNDLGQDITNACTQAVEPMRWRSPAPVAVSQGMFTGQRRDVSKGAPQ